MRVFNIMLSRDLGGIQQSFLDYSKALKIENHDVVNITSMCAKINNKCSDTIKLPNLFPYCLISKIYLRIIIAIYKPDIILAHGRRAISFARFFKPDNVSLVGIAHNYQTKRIKKCDYIISVADGLIEYFKTKGIDRKRMFKLPNSIKITNEYKPKKYNPEIVIGSFGRFVANKGFNYLIEAMYLLKIKGYKCTLLLGGDGAEKENLHFLVKKFNLEKEIKFIGWVEDKDAFFKKIDIFCLPSALEPFGIILLEAMANSTPIVATRSGGPAEILRNGKDGLIAEIDQKDIASKLELLINNEKLAKNLANSAYSRLSAEFELKLTAKKLTLILTEIKKSKIIVKHCLQN